jgi:cysteine desulfurase family protein
MLFLENASQKSLTMTKKQIYMDNAATSFSKPPAVLDAMMRFMSEVGANPDRSHHVRSTEASSIAVNARKLLARLFNISDPNRIIFTLNATESLNTVIFGVLKDGDHVIMTQMEHNSVIRPLRYLESKGAIEVSVAPCDRMGFLDVGALKKLVRKQTALIVLNHASNVCGTIQDVMAVRQATDEIPLLLDAAQTAGVVPIDVMAMGIDFLAFTGHKALYGPQGTGGLYIREGRQVRPLKQGGTGTFSEQEQQPVLFPDYMESGTRNNVGIAGLAEGVKFILDTGMDRIREHEARLLETFVDSVIDLPGVTLYGPLKPGKQVSILSMTFDQALPDGMHQSFGGCGNRAIPATFESIHPAEAGSILEQEFEIFVRVGLHCAPLAHKALGSFPDGTVRFSLGYFNTVEEVQIAVSAVRKIAEKKDYLD